MSPSLIQSRLLPAIFSFTLITLTLAACEMRLQIPSSSNGHDLPVYEFEATGEDFLISALDEVQAIADWSPSFTNGLGGRISDADAAGKKREAVVTGTDSVYIYGEVIPGGYGAVVTEKYARPKGLLLITVRKTYGKGNGHIVTETNRYASHADHLSDNPQQTNVTELFGLQTDTIVTHVLRNGTLQTYTFRLPVVTRVISPQDGSIRATSRYGVNGQIISKTVDGDGNLVQLRRSYGQIDGSTITRTEYPDDSWRQVRTRGESDGTVTRETTSGLPSMGSGTATPGPTPKPVMSIFAPNPRLECREPSLDPFEMGLLASGACVSPIPPRPRPCGDSRTQVRFFASGMSVSSRNIPRPKGAIYTTVTSRQVASGLPTPGPVPRPVLASGLTVAPRPPRPVLASGVTSVPKPPVLQHASGIGTMPKPPILRPALDTRARSFCSGMQATHRRPPRPILT